MNTGREMVVSELWTFNYFFYGSKIEVLADYQHVSSLLSINNEDLIVKI